MTLGLWGKRPSKQSRSKGNCTPVGGNSCHCPPSLLFTLCAPSDIPNALGYMKTEKEQWIVIMYLKRQFVWADLSRSTQQYHPHNDCHETASYLKATPLHLNSTKNTSHPAVSTVTKLCNVTRFNYSPYVYKMTWMDWDSPTHCYKLHSTADTHNSRWFLGSAPLWTRCWCPPLSGTLSSPPWSIRLPPGILVVWAAGWCRTAVWDSHRAISASRWEMKHNERLCDGRMFGGHQVITVWHSAENHCLHQRRLTGHRGPQVQNTRTYSELPDGLFTNADVHDLSLARSLSLCLAEHIVYNPRVR